VFRCVRYARGPPGLGGAAPSFSRGPGGVRSFGVGSLGGWRRGAVARGLGWLAGVLRSFASPARSPCTFPLCYGNGALSFFSPHRPWSSPSIFQPTHVAIPAPAWTLRSADPPANSASERDRVVGRVSLWTLLRSSLLALISAVAGLFSSAPIFVSLTRHTGGPPPCHSFRACSTPSFLLSYDPNVALRQNVAIFLFYSSTLGHHHPFISGPPPRICVRPRSAPAVTRFGTGLRPCCCLLQCFLPCFLHLSVKESDGACGQPLSHTVRHACRTWRLGFPLLEPLSFFTSMQVSRHCTNLYFFTTVYLTCSAPRPWELFFPQTFRIVEVREWITRPAVLATFFYSACHIQVPTCYGGDSTMVSVGHQLHLRFFFFSAGNYFFSSSFLVGPPLSPPGFSNPARKRQAARGLR